MQRWGRSASGKPRWFCKFCSKSRIQKRSDTTEHWQKHLFTRWLIGTTPLSNIAEHKSRTRQTLTKWFSSFWRDLPQPIIPRSLSETYLVVDAIYLAGHHECVLIGRTGKGHVFWMFAMQETLSAWLEFFNMLPTPIAVICDGQGGLLSAMKTTWPQVPIQRCLAHVQRLAIQRLTRRPQTPAGQELLGLLYATHHVKTAQDTKIWFMEFEAWRKRWKQFLQERTYGIHPSGKNSWWYTHRRIRAMKYTLEQSLPNLFAFIDYPGVPNTTNLVEGGINSRLKELLHRHRGMNLGHKKAIVAYFLNSRSMPRKPTRYFT